MIYELSSEELRNYVKTYKRKNILSTLENETPDKIYLNNIPGRKIKLLKYLSKYGVIGGSMALKLYGVLQRDVYDVDLVCEDAGYIYLKTNHNKYSFDGYSSFSPIAKFHIDCLGVRKRNISIFKVDIFIKNDISYNEYDGIRLQPLNDIISEKTQIMRSKDKTDLKEILSRIESDQFIIKTKRGIFRKIFEPFCTTV